MSDGNGGTEPAHDEHPGKPTAPQPDEPQPGVPQPGVPQPGPPQPPEPGVPQPQGDYRAAVVDGGLALSAGMTPRVAGRLTVTGLVGRDVSLATAQEAAGLAARNAVAAILAELPDGAGGLRRFLRMTVYVACADGFHELSAVADGATAVLRTAMADRGGRVALPVRSAVGVRALPSGAPVEVELMAAVAP